MGFTVAALGGGPKWEMMMLPEHVHSQVGYCAAAGLTSQRHVTCTHCDTCFCLLPIALLPLLPFAALANQLTGVMHGNQMQTTQPQARSGPGGAGSGGSARRVSGGRGGGGAPRELRDSLEVSYVDEAEVVFTTLSSSARQIFGKIRCVVDAA